MVGLAIKIPNHNPAAPVQPFQSAMPPNPFKVGDKVVCVDAVGLPSLTEGETYTVTWVTPKGQPAGVYLGAAVPGYPSHLRASRFRLASAEAAKDEPTRTKALDMNNPEIRKMVARNHKPGEAWTREGGLVGVTCRTCHQDWPCRPYADKLAWSQGFVANYDISKLRQT
jgi:hypothetical protein